MIRSLTPSLWFSPARFSRQLGVFAVVAATVASDNAQGASLSLSASTSPYFEDFTSFTGTAAGIPTGWSAAFSGTAVYNGQGNGTGVTGGTGGVWSLGSSPGSDYSFGAVRSGTAGNVTLGFGATNGTGLIVESVAMGWDYEQWRFKNTSGLDVSGTGTLSGNATVNAKDFTGTASGTDGTPATTSVSAFVVSGISAAPGANLGLSWVTTDVIGADNGMSIDNFSFRINQVGTGGVDRTVTSLGYDSGVTVRNGGAGDSQITTTSSATETLAGTLTDGGAGSLSLGINGTGTLSLTNSANDFSGQVNLNAGTLLLGASNVISTSSGVDLNGGTLATSGGLSETTGSLSLTSASVIDFGTSSSGTSALSFAALSGTAVLSIYNWTGLAGIVGQAEQLIIRSGITAGTNYTNIQFYSGGAGSTLLGSARAFSLGGGAVELVPVPELSALGGAVLLLGAGLWRERRTSHRARA